MRNGPVGAHPTERGTARTLAGSVRGLRDRLYRNCQLPVCPPIVHFPESCGQLGHPSHQASVRRHRGGRSSRIVPVLPVAVDCDAAKSPGADSYWRSTHGGEIGNVPRSDERLRKTPMAIIRSIAAFPECGVQSGRRRCRRLKARALKRIEERECPGLRRAALAWLSATSGAPEPAEKARPAAPRTLARRASPFAFESELLAARHRRALPGRHHPHFGAATRSFRWQGSARIPATGNHHGRTPAGFVLKK
jgi:hypothetical protein